MGLIGRRVRRKMQRRARRAHRPGWIKALVFGMLLMAAGLFALLDRFWPGMPGMDQLWPVFPMFGGFVFLLTFVAKGMKDPGPVFPGVAALGVGAFFFLFTVGPLDYSQMDQLWPVFPLIGGVAFFWTWAASFGRKIGLLIPAGLATMVGVVGLVFTLSSAGSAALLLGWPVLLLLAGMALIMVVLVKQVFRWAKTVAP